MLLLWTIYHVCVYYTTGNIIQTVHNQVDNIRRGQGADNKVWGKLVKGSVNISPAIYGVNKKKGEILKRSAGKTIWGIKKNKLGLSCAKLRANFG